MVLPIIGFDNEILRKKSKPVARVNRSVRKIIDDMLRTMRAARGVGLAAPQIGVSKRIAIVDVGEGPHFMVNPEIVSRSEEETEDWEGCLSWPGYVGLVPRSDRVCVRALDRDGREFWIEGEGFLARALQHEIDHLDGVLFKDRASLIMETPKEEEREEEDGGTVTAIFMGSPEFAVPSLEALVGAGVNVPLVITQPDRPYGRKQVMKPTPVKECALRLGLPVMTPESLDGDALEKIRSLGPDFLCVAAFGQKIPSEIIESPKYAALNVHPSLLPKHRGGNPVQRAIMRGDGVTGVSIMHISDRMDAGDILLQWPVDIGPDETYGTLEKRLAEIGAHALLDAVELTLAGKASRHPQDEREATYARHLMPGENEIDWKCEPRTIHNLIRGLSPKPGAVCYFSGKSVKVWASVLPDGSYPPTAPGAILKVEGDALLVGCKGGVIGITEIQPAGKKPMSGKAFYLGRSGEITGFEGG